MRLNWFKKAEKMDESSGYSFFPPGGMGKLTPKYFKQYQEDLIAVFEHEKKAGRIKAEHILTNPSIIDFYEAMQSREKNNDSFVSFGMGGLGRENVFLKVWHASRFEGGPTHPKSSHLVGQGSIRDAIALKFLHLWSDRFRESPWNLNPGEVRDLKHTLDHQSKVAEGYIQNPLARFGKIFRSRMGRMQFDCMLDSVLKPGGFRDCLFSHEEMSKQMNEPLDDAGMLRNQLKVEGAFPLSRNDREIIQQILHVSGNVRIPYRAVGIEEKIQKLADWYLKWLRAEPSLAQAILGGPRYILRLIEVSFPRYHYFGNFTRYNMDTGDFPEIAVGTWNKVKQPLLELAQTRMGDKWYSWLERNEARIP